MAIPLNNPNLTPQQLKDFQDLQQLLQRAGKNADAFADAINKAGSNTTKIAQELQGMEGYVNGLTNATKQFNASLTDSLDLAQGIVDALKKQEGAIQRATKAMSSIVSLGQQLVYEDQKLDALSERQLEKMTKEAKLRGEQLKDQVKTIAGSVNQQTINTRILQFEQQLATAIQNQDTKTQDILEKKLEILKAYNDSEKPYQTLVNLVKERYHLEQKVSKTFGLTGVALAAASSIASKFGMSHIQDQLEDINNKLRYEMREEIKANGNQALGFGRRFEYAARAVGGVSKAILKGMFDPLFIMGKIYSAFLDVNKASVQLERLTGQNSQALAGANFQVASTVDVLQVAVELTEQLGFNAQNAFSSEVLAGAAGLKNEMGLAADEAGGLAIMAQTTTGDINGMVDGIVATTSAFNKANRSAISQGQVLKDVAKTSDSIKLSLGNNPQAIAKAASAARRLGLELKDVDAIASSLMNFEDSISAELEAELLTGKQLNLEKARELALTNDLAGLGDELFKNSADINEFGKMNRIQQDAYAKALGLTKDQLARIAYNKAIDANMTKEQAAAAAGVTAESMKQMDVQERITKALDKLAQAFAPILDIVADLADVIGAIITPIAGVVGWVVKMLNSLYLIKPLLIGIALYFTGGAIAKGIGSMVGGIRDFGKGILSATKNFKLLNLQQAIFEKASALKKGAGSLVQNIKDKFKEGLTGKAADAGGGLADKAKDAVVGKAEDAAGSLADKAKEKAEELAGGKVDNLAEKVTGGAEDVAKPAKGGVRKGLQDLAAGLKSMGNKGVIQGIGNLALAGPAMLVAVASIPFLLTIAAVGVPAGIGLKGLASGLKALGKAGAGALEGIGILALFGVALIPFTYALSLLSPLIESFGKAIKSTFEGIGAVITAVADGFVKLMGAVSMDNVGPMLLLGPALFGIAAGLGAVAIAGLTAIPAIGGLILLSKAAPALVSFGIGGGESKSAGEAKGKADEGSMAIVAQKLDVLIELTKRGTSVKLDGKVLATSNTNNQKQVGSNLG